MSRFYFFLSVSVLDHDFISDFFSVLFDSFSNTMLIKIMKPEDYGCRLLLSVGVDILFISYSIKKRYQPLASN